MKKKAFIVLGLGYGDEGKGIATDYLCKGSSSPLVVRFNGAYQAGHTVVTSNGKRHVFSSFGAGTFRGIPTYWSNYCAFSPTLAVTEYEKLQAIEVQPVLMIDCLCPITTHYDELYNQAIEHTRGNNRHGSCGLGFGATIERQKVLPLKFYAQDLLHPIIYNQKLNAIREYYQEKINIETEFNFDQFDHEQEDTRFKFYVDKFTQLISTGYIRLVHEREVFSQNGPWETFIFEGAQGILLDMKFGIYPYVTRSNTTSKNAIELLNNNFSMDIHIEILYVTRCYQTRHGEGPFFHNKNLKLINQECETNQFNKHQGEFRTDYLNTDLLNYALSCDSNFSVGLSKHLLITCLDQLMNNQIECYHNSIFITVDPEDFTSLLEHQFETCRFSFSSCSDNIY